ncbi:unnamed protein product, partial [Brugia pahangi]|uniref:Secreted protein n=1 Tax=Brugia pahangi TaxID=6280 RepID=A0A0N4SWQ6_BRUPA
IHPSFILFSFITPRRSAGDARRSAGDTVRFRPALLRFVSTHKCTKYSELLMKDAGELIVSNDSSANFSYDYYEVSTFFNLINYNC